MSKQWIENQRAGSGQHCIRISERKQSTDASALPALASNFDREPNQRLQNFGIVFGYFADNTLKHASRSAHSPTAIVQLALQNDFLRALYGLSQQTLRLRAFISLASIGNFGSLGQCVSQGKPDLKAGLAGLRSNLNSSPVLFYNTLDRVQTEARAFSNPFG